MDDARLDRCNDRSDPAASIAVCNGVTSEEAVRAPVHASVLSLYRRDRISSGKAARLLEVNRLAFIQMLAEEGIPYLDCTPAELEDELAVVMKPGADE